MLAIFFTCGLFFVNCSTSKGISLNVTNNCLKYVFAKKLSLIEQNSQECVNYKTIDGISTLMVASLKGDDEIVSYLLHNGVDLEQVDGLGQNALSYAILHHQISTARLLVGGGVKIIPNNFGITPLMSAAQLGDYELVAALNPSEVNINLRAGDGWTALYFSIRGKNKEIFDYLVARGACSSLKDNYGQTPYDFAVSVGWSYARDRLKRTISCKNIARN
jgi:ankyrin repeat protein